jgi:hypothetical protein
VAGTPPFGKKDEAMNRLFTLASMLLLLGACGVGADSPVDENGQPALTSVEQDLACRVIARCPNGTTLTCQGTTCGYGENSCEIICDGRLLRCAPPLPGQLPCRE